jgi:hypothetical protein
MTSLTNLTTRIDRALTAIDRKRRPRLIHCAGAREELIAMVEQQIANHPEDQEEQDATSEQEFEAFCIEGKEFLGAAVAWTEREFNVRFVP